MLEGLFALMGGVLIGLAAVLLLLSNGQIMGVSGILKQLLPPVANDWTWRVVFLAGVLSVPLFYPVITDWELHATMTDNMLLLVAGGFLVGTGTAIGNGCTSGHGVCGLSRLSPRSFVSVGIFMSAAVITVSFVRHVLGS